MATKPEFVASKKDIVALVTVSVTILSPRMAIKILYPVLSIRAGSRPKQPATGQSLAGYFLLT